MSVVLFNIGGLIGSDMFVIVFFQGGVVYLQAGSY